MARNITAIPSMDIGIIQTCISVSRPPKRKRRIGSDKTAMPMPAGMAMILVTMSIFVRPDCMAFLSFLAQLSDKLTTDMLPNFIYGSYTGLAVTVFGLVPTITAMFGKSILPSLAESCAKNDKKAVNEVREHNGGELVRKQAVKCVWRSFHGGFDTRIDSEHIYHVGKGHYH